MKLLVHAVYEQKAQIYKKVSYFNYQTINSKKNRGRKNVEKFFLMLIVIYEYNIQISDIRK